MHSLWMRLQHLGDLPCWIRCCLMSTAPWHSWQEQSSCSHSYSQLLFHILLAQLFLQLCGDEGKHPAERQSNFCWISFQLYPFCNPVHCMSTETCTLSQRSGLSAEGQRDNFWALDAGMAYSASALLQPKGAIPAWTVRSSGKEKSPKESISCLVVAWAHSLGTSTTGGELDGTEGRSTWHLLKTGQEARVEAWRIRPSVMLSRLRTRGIGAYVMWINNKYYKKKHTLELKITYFGLHILSYAELFDRLDDVAFSSTPPQGIWNFL